MNVSKAVLDNVPQAMVDLVSERRQLVRRLDQVNREWAALQTLLDVTEGGAAPDGHPPTGD
jgi:hypothetical protein